MEGLEKKLEDLAVALEGKSKEQVANEIKSFKEDFTKEFEGKVNESAKSLLEAGTKAIKEEFEAKLEAKQKHLDALDIKVNKSGVQTESKSMEVQLKEQKDELFMVATKSSNKEIEIKASTNRAAVSGNQQAVELPEIGQLAHRKLSMYDVFPKFPVSGSNNNGIIRYYDWDEDTIARAAAMVAEGAAFPESTAKWVTRTVDLKKIGDTLPVTEEFFEDESMFAAELGQFLRTNVDLIVDEQIANGDGTGNNLTGLKASVDAYTPVASGITDASIYDLIPKVSEVIVTAGGSKYAPNVVFMHRSDINKYKLKKDNNNNYVIPPFVSRDGNVIDGVTVIESNVLTANELVLGDSRFARIYEKGGVMLTQGEVNAQFTSDMKTLKARKRLLFLIRGADKGAWKKVTSISAALTTLAS